MCYVYNGDGNLVLRIIDGVRTYYPGRHFDQEVSGSVTTVKKYYSLNGQTVAVRTVQGETDTLNWILNDHLGSASITAAVDGSKLAELRYSAFGEVRFSSGTTPTEYQYTGQLNDSSIQLSWYNSRWYDSQLGHFIQPDTLIPNLNKSSSWDRYLYVVGNPIRYNDPSGNKECESAFICNDRTTTDDLLLGALKRNPPAAGSVTTKFGAPNTFYEDKLVNHGSDREKLNWMRELDNISNKPKGAHAGVDIGNGTYGEGTALYAIAPGKVVSIVATSDKKAPGFYLIIEHKIGNTKYYAVYFHIQGDMKNGPVTDLKVGDTVKTGDVVAHMGHTGTSEAHLHFEIRREGGVQNASGGTILANPQGYWLSDPSQLDTTWVDISSAFGGYSSWYPQSCMQGDSNGC